MARKRKASVEAENPPTVAESSRKDESTGSGKTALKKRNENDAAKSLILLQKEDDTAESSDTFNAEWMELVESAPLIHMGLRGDVSDATFIAFGQCVPALLTQDDRVGKYKHRPIGFVGFCCTYCQGQPGFGRYFPGSYDSLLNGTNSSGILQHLLTECRRCPPRVRNILSDLSATALEAAPGKTDLSLNVSKLTHRPKYGSRKRFFTFLWNQLRKIDQDQQQKSANDDPIVEAITTPEDNDKLSLPQESSTDNGVTCDVLMNEIDTKNSKLFEQIVESSEIVHMQDRYLVSDVTLIAMAQMKVCYVTAEDQIGRCKDHVLGFKGLCCLHCGGKAGKPGYGRYFPSSLRSLAQADSCQQIIKHVSTKCGACPQDVRQLIVDLSKTAGSMNACATVELPGGRIKYGSRKIFFRRVWARLHGEVSPEVAEMGDPAIDDDNVETLNDDLSRAPNASSNDRINEDVPISWERVIGKDNPVVNLETDKGLISDSQLAAIAQMSICRLTEEDRIGWFKNRTLGFGGLCCRHCGGRPSFGRYFPNSVRSFAQTTSSQTIISHIALYCPKCPKDIRDIVMQLQRKENDVSGTATLNHSNYGSRKIFFDRVWSRVHPPSEDGASSDVVIALTDGTADSSLVLANDEEEQSELSTLKGTVTARETEKKASSKNCSTPSTIDDVNESVSAEKSQHETDMTELNSQPTLTVSTSSRKRLKTSEPTEI